jgi:hypothetical protein
MVLLICACIAWAVMGAGKQLAIDTRDGVLKGIVKIRRDASRKAAQIRARGWSSPSRWALAGAVGTWSATKVVARLSRAAGMSIRAGWIKGWAQGKKKHAEFVARRKEREEAAAAEWDAANGTDAKEVVAQKAPVVEPIDQQPPMQRNGAEMANSGEVTNIEDTRSTLASIAQSAQGFESRVDTLSANLQSANMDSETLNEVMAILEAASATRTAAFKALSGMNQRHGAMEDAVNSTPQAAKTEFYKH